VKQNSYFKAMLGTYYFNFDCFDVVLGFHFRVFMGFTVFSIYKAMLSG